MKYFDKSCITIPRSILKKNVTRTKLPITPLEHLGVLHRLLDAMRAPGYSRSTIYHVSVRRIYADKKNILVKSMVLLYFETFSRHT